MQGVSDRASARVPFVSISAWDRKKPDVELSHQDNVTALVSFCIGKQMSLYNLCPYFMVL